MNILQVFWYSSTSNNFLSYYPTVSQYMSNLWSPPIVIQILSVLASSVSTLATYRFDNSVADLVTLPSFNQINIQQSCCIVKRFIQKPGQMFPTCVCATKKTLSNITNAGCFPKKSYFFRDAIEMPKIWPGHCFEQFHCIVCFVKF